MAEYEVKLKRTGQPTLIITVEGSKFSLNDGAVLFNAAIACARILAIIETMKSEGLEWIRVDKK